MENKEKVIQTFKAVFKAALAGIEMGDDLAKINGSKPISPNIVKDILLDNMAIIERYEKGKIDADSTLEQIGFNFAKIEAMKNRYPDPVIHKPGGIVMAGGGEYIVHNNGVPAGVINETDIDVHPIDHYHE